MPSFYDRNPDVNTQPEAFLSYTRLDDEYFGGAITSLRKFLELGVQVITGQRSFKIFQDVDGIEFGEQWQQRLDQQIRSTSFLVPIVTPLFFQSDACRGELEKFIVHEQEQGRNDLILPVYYVTVPILENQDLLRDDQLAAVIASRQRYDWRSKADLPVTDPQVKAAVRQLSEKIAAALARTPTPPTGLTNSQTSIGEKAKASAFARASESVERAEPEKKAGKRKKVLWVDDRPDNNIHERRAMAAYNIDFELAESTGEALAKLGKMKFDAIISDMGRPPDPEAGYTLLNALRNSGNLTPFFIYAGSNSEEHLRLALSKGAQGSTNSANILITNVLNSLNE
jgi:CheY-like chemotaxis protein